MECSNNPCEKHLLLLGKKGCVPGCRLWVYRKPPKMHKRPIIRPRVAARALPPITVPSGFPSIVGQLVDQLRNTQVPSCPQKPWTPSIDYAFIASRLAPGEREAYIQKSREWFEANAPVAPVVDGPEKCALDNTHIITAIAKHARETGRHGRPPVKEMVKAMHAGGYTEERIDKYRQWCQHMEDTAEERQEVLDRIFAKYPSASKPDPKPKVKKVIKAVKKRMGNEQAD